MPLHSVLILWPLPRQAIDFDLPNYGISELCSCPNMFKTFTCAEDTCLGRIISGMLVNRPYEKF